MFFDYLLAVVFVSYGASQEAGVPEVVLIGNASLLAGPRHTVLLTFSAQGA